MACIRRLCFTLTLLFCMAVYSDVAAQTFLQIDRSPRLASQIIPATSVAGRSSSDTREIGRRGRFQGIYGIMFAERRDRPCYIEVRTRHINTGDTIPVRSMNICDHRNGYTQSSRRFALAQFFNAQRRFIWQLQVCNSDGNTNGARLKGLRVWYANVDDEGIVTPVGNEVEAKQPNCNTGSWGNFSTCPEGSIATRLEVHMANDTRGTALSGIRLLCRQVVQNPTAATFGAN